MGWTYDMLAALSAAAFNPTSGEADANLNDTLGFAFDTGMGLPGAGFTWCVDFEWYEKGVDAETGAPKYTVMTNTDALVANVAAQERLFNSRGVIQTNSDLCNQQISVAKAVDGIRQQFSLDKILFGGVVVLGALDHDDYQDMENGFGIAPIPLYAVNEDSQYTTAIHNLARVLGISKCISAARYEHATAFLDFQALNSDDVMNEYNKSLKYETVGGEEYNIEMLEYLRAHIRNNMDQYLDNMAGNGTVMPGTFTSGERFGKYFGNVTSNTVAKKVGDIAETKNKIMKNLVSKFLALP
jgi:hypothetical protein